MSHLEAIASCIAGYDPDALPVAQAKEFIERLVPVVDELEVVDIRDEKGRRYELGVRAEARALRAQGVKIR